MRVKIRRRVLKSGKVVWPVFVTEGGRGAVEHAHGTYPTQQEAKAAAAALQADTDRGRYVQPAELTVAGYLEGEWLPARANADISENARDVERIMVKAWIGPHIGDVPLQRLTARHLDGLYATLRDRGGRNGQPLRGKSVRNVHALLSKALGDAVRRGHIAASPALAVDPPARDDSVERTAWTIDEVIAFLHVSDADRLHAVWRVAITAGLRRAELDGLQWDDADDNSLVIARQVLIRPGGGRDRVYVRPTTKSRRVRRVRIDEATAADLRRWKAEQAQERLAFGAPWRTDGGLGIEAPWIVTEPDGSVVNPGTLLARWKRLVKVAGVTPIGLHGARHTYAELALASGARLDVVSRQLGHSSVAITGDIYTHDSDEAAREAAELVARTIEGTRTR
jgi:integrase